MLFVPTSVYCYNFILISRTRESYLMLWNYNAAAGGNSISVWLLKCFLLEVEPRTQGSRPRTQKKSEPKTNYRLSEDRPSRGRGQECSRPRTQRASVLQEKKKVFAQKVANFSWNFSQGKNVHDLGRFSTNQKNSAVLGREQGIFGDLEASRSRTWPSRPRTSWRTPPLISPLFFFILLYCRTSYLFGISIC